MNSPSASHLLTLPVASGLESLAQETVSQLERQTATEVNPDAANQSSEENHVNGLIADLAWI